MSKPTRFFVFLNSTYMLTVKINTVKGFDQDLFRLVAKVTEGFSPVKGSEAPNPPKRQALNPVRGGRPLDEGRQVLEGSDRASRLLELASGPSDG